MHVETRLVAILCCDLYLKIPAVGIRSLEHRRVSQAINEVIHYWERLSVCHRGLLEPL